MPILPISKKQLDKLGDRLRDSVTPEAADVDLFAQQAETERQFRRRFVELQRRVAWVEGQ